MYVCNENIQFENCSISETTASPLSPQAKHPAISPIRSSPSPSIHVFTAENSEQQLNPLSVVPHPHPDQDVS
jgi:hypothetical protein